MAKTIKRNKKFWDRIAPKYARDPIKDESAYQAKLAMARGHLRKDMHLFEFGCGTGSTALALADSVARIDATDLSSEMIRIAEEKAKAAGVTNVHFHRSDIAHWDAEPASYDGVMAHSILHLLPDRREVMAQAVSFLKPGGLFISSTVCMRDMAFFWRLILPVMRMIGLAPYVGIFSQEELIAEQEAAGLTIIEQWKPKPDAAVFLIAQKREAEPTTGGEHSF